MLLIAGLKYVPIHAGIYSALAYYAFVIFNTNGHKDISYMHTFLTTK